MVTLKRLRLVKKTLFAPLTILVLAGLLFVLLRATYGVYINERDSREELENTRRNAEELSAREAFLSNEIQRLESPRGLEEELRSKFPVAKEGEHVVIIVEPQSGEATSLKEKPAGFWNRFLNIFR